MKHATSRFLFSYWDGLRGERAAPDRALIEPGAIRHVLADTFILGCGTGREQATFRLAGTRISALFGMDLRGHALRDLWPPTKRDEVDRLIDLVLSETASIVVGVRGGTAEGHVLDLELVMLPLRHHGRTHARVLGGLSPASLPTWAGLMPIVVLETTTMRIVNAARDSRHPSGLRRDSAEARRQGFVVHEGGRR